MTTTNATDLSSSLTVNGVEIPRKDGRVCFGRVLEAMGYKDPSSMMTHCFQGSGIPPVRVFRERGIDDIRYWVTPEDAIALFRGYSSQFKPQSKRAPLVEAMLNALKSLCGEVPAPSAPPQTIEVTPTTATPRASVKEDGAALAAELAEDAAPATLPIDARAEAIQESLPFVDAAFDAPVAAPEVLPAQQEAAPMEVVPVLPNGTREMLFEGWLLAARGEGEAPLVLDLELGRRVGKARPHDIRVTIKNLIAQGELEGIFATNAKNPGGDGERRGRPGTAYWLTPTNALVVLTQLNLPIAREVRKEMSRVYEAWNKSIVAKAPTPTTQSLPVLATREESLRPTEAPTPAPMTPTIAERIAMAQLEAQAADALRDAGAEPSIVAQLKLRAAQTATGRSTAAFAPPTGSIYVHTPEAMATHHGTSASHIGKIAGALGLKGEHGEGKPGASETYRAERPDGVVVVLYRYSDAARRKIAEALAKERAAKPSPRALPAK